MVLPAGVTTCLVFKKAPVSFGGSTAKVQLEITPSVRLVHTATGTPFADFVESVAPTEGGVAQLMLPYTDQIGFQDEAGNAFTNWHYTARIRLEKQGHQPKTLPLISFQIPTGQTEVDLSLVPTGQAALPTLAPTVPVTSINGRTGAVELELLSYEQLARTPEQIIVGTITYTGDAPTSAAVTWPDGTPGTYNGTPSAAFPGSIDSYTITYGVPVIRTYTQPPVTRDANGNITAQPAITVS